MRRLFGLEVRVYGLFSLNWGQFGSVSMWRGVNEGDFLRLRDAFARAALDGELWLPTLQDLADATASSRAELVGFTAEAPAFNWTTGIDDACMAHFRSFDAADPGLNFRLAAAERAGVGKTVHEADYAAVMPGLTGEAFVEFCEDWGMTFGCQATLTVEGGLLIGMSVLRSRRDGVTTAGQRALFAALTPHVRAAVRTRAALEGQGAELIAGALQAMATPAFLLDALGQVRNLTPAAEALVSAGDRVRLQSGRLRGSSPREDEALRQAVARAAASAAGMTGEGVVALRGANGQGEPLVLDIHVLPREPWTFGFRPSVLVVARKPSRGRRRVAELLVQAFGLTAAEADIAEQLSRGVSREEIARSRGVSLGTVRIQIKAIFRKLDVSREGELIVRVGLFR